MAVSKSPSGAYTITATQLDSLRTELGDSIPVGLTRVQARVLAALARSPRGLASIRSVARRAGVSPTAAGRTLDTLTQAGLARAEKQTLALGRATPVVVYSAVVDHPRWHELAPALAETLKRIRRRLCVAVGATKAPIIKAALLAGAVTDLVIDDAAAELLVD